MKYIVTSMRTNDGAIVEAATVARDEVAAAIWINECIESDKDATDCSCKIRCCDKLIEKVSAKDINTDAMVEVFFENGERYTYQVLYYNET